MNTNADLIRGLRISLKLHFPRCNRFCCPILAGSALIGRQPSNLHCLFIKVEPEANAGRINSTFKGNYVNWCRLRYICSTDSHIKPLFNFLSDLFSRDVTWRALVIPFKQRFTLSPGLRLSLDRFDIVNTCLFWRIVQLYYYNIKIFDECKPSLCD